MLRKISLTIACLLLINIPGYTASAIDPSLKIGVPFTFNLAAHASQIVNSMWPINAECTITSDSKSGNIDLFAEVLSKQGKVNDKTLQAGQNIRLNLTSGEHLKLQAEPRAIVRVMNMDDYTIHANCIFY